MESLTTYSKFPVYPQPYTGSSNNSIIDVEYTPVGYIAATDSGPQLRSTHLEQNEVLDDCGITPSLLKIAHLARTPPFSQIDLKMASKDHIILQMQQHTPCHQLRLIQQKHGTVPMKSPYWSGSLAKSPRSSRKRSAKAQVDPAAALQPLPVPHLELTGSP